MGKLRASVRMQQILDMLTSGAEISVTELAETFKVTTMTIRRDLERLEQEGQVTRTHGGAIAAAPSVIAFAFQERRQSRLREKQAIARAAVRLVEPGMAVILDTGTTTLEVARAMAGINDLRVLTSSLAIASALFAHEGLELVLLGGTVNAGSPDLSGPLTEENLGNFRADLAFIGADAVNEEGLYTKSQHIAGVSRAMIGSAEKTVLVADSSKSGQTSFIRFANWTEVDEWIVNDGLPSGQKSWARKTVGTLTCASVCNS